MNRLWYIPSLQFKKIGQGSWRLVHPQLPFLHAKFELHPDQCMLWHQANAFLYSDRSESLVISFPAILFGSSVGGSESRAAYQCPHCKCARLAFCLNASVVGAREHSSQWGTSGLCCFCAHIR